MAAISRWTLSITGFGVPAGATTPIQVELSAMSGKLGGNGEARHVRQQRQRAVTVFRQRAEFAGLDQRQAVGDAVLGEIDGTGEQPLGDVGAALVGHQRDVDTGGLRERERAEPRGDRAGAALERTGIGFGLGDQTRKLSSGRRCAS